MKLRGAPAEQARGIEEAAEEFTHARRGLLPGRGHIGRGQRRRLGRSERTHLRVIGRNLGEGVAPSVSLIRHEALQNAEGYLRAIGAAVMERSDHRRDVREAAVRREKRAHFEIGVDARLRTAKELKNEAAAVNHGGVALLAAQHAGGWGTRRIGIRWEPWGAR